MGKKAPDPPDYAAAAERTAEGNQQMLDQQTRANRPNMYTPWGQQTWTESPNGQWSSTIQLSPDQQAALDAQMGLTAGRSGIASGMLGRVANEYGQAPDYSQYTGYADTPQGMTLDPSSRYYDEAGDAVYGQFERRMEPRFEQASAAMDAQLRNQGLRPGDQAYDYQMSQLMQGQDDARLQAMDQATRVAGAEASRMYGMDADAERLRYGQAMDSAGYQNQLRQAQIAEDMQRRGYSLNEINALLTGQQIGMPQMPGFQRAGYTSGPNYMGAAQAQYQGALDQYSAQQAQLGGLMGGLAGIATAPLTGGGSTILGGLMGYG